MKTRRDFVKAGLAVGVTFSLVDLGGLFAQDNNSTEASASPQSPGASNEPRPVLVAVRDSDRVSMLNKAIAELGGMSAFVKPGQTVVIKPNIGWDAPPERGANTHPDIVGRLVTLCREAGAKSVSVFDNTCDELRLTYARSGIADAVKAAGGIMVDGKDQSLYREVAIPDGVSLKSAKIHSLILDSDVFINAPVLKHHSGALMTASMKNLMGIIWDRGFYHKNDLHQCIADILTKIKPQLNVLDAYHPMVRNGPRGKTVDDVVEMKTLLASRDIVAIDAAATKMLGHQPTDVRHVSIGANMKLGVMDLTRVDIRRIKLA